MDLYCNLQYRGWFHSFKVSNRISHYCIYYYYHEALTCKRKIREFEGKKIHYANLIQPYQRKIKDCDLILKNSKLYNWWHKKSQLNVELVICNQIKVIDLDALTKPLSFLSRRTLPCSIYPISSQPNHHHCCSNCKMEVMNNH